MSIFLNNMPYDLTRIIYEYSFDNESYDNVVKELKKEYKNCCSDQKDFANWIYIKRYKNYYSRGFKEGLQLKLDKNIHGYHLVLFFDKYDDYVRFKTSNTYKYLIYTNIII